MKQDKLHPQTKQNDLSAILNVVNRMKDLIIEDKNIDTKTKRDFLMLYLLFKSYHTMMMTKEVLKYKVFKKYYLMLVKK